MRGELIVPYRKTDRVNSRRSLGPDIENLASALAANATLFAHSDGSEVPRSDRPRDAEPSSTFGRANTPPEAIN